MAHDLVVPPIPAELSSDAPGFAAELDEAIFVGAEPPESARAWQVGSRGEAEWAMRKLAVLRERQRDVRTQAIEWRERIDAWAADEAKRIEPAVEFFEGHLQRYAVEQRALTGDATVRLPSGEISTRKPTKPTVQIDNDEALLAWLEDFLPSGIYEDVVQIVHKPKLVELRRNVETRPVEMPWCVVCGVPLLDLIERGRIENGEDWKPGEGVRWAHEDEPLQTYDHPATPAPGFEVVWKSPPLDAFPEVPSGLDGTLVPGLSAAIGDVTASVTPRR